MSKVKLSNIVAEQFPEFIRSDYPTFVAFVEAYYEFLQQGYPGKEWSSLSSVLIDDKIFWQNSVYKCLNDGTLGTTPPTYSSNKQTNGDVQLLYVGVLSNYNYDLSQIRDIDQTLDIFIEQFKSELASNLPPQTLIDQRKLLQHLKDQYLAKGTEASYKFLFRVLFDKEVDVQYPGQQMLRASDGRWSQDVTIFARVKRGRPSDVYGQYVDVITPNKTITIRVENWRWATIYRNGIPEVSNSIVELFIDKKFYGTISYDYIIKFENFFEATILPTTSNIKIVTRGAGFKPGQLYRVKSALGDGSILKISRVNEDGGIMSAQFIKYGVGYQTDFTATISPPSEETFTPLSILGDAITVSDRTGGFVESGIITYSDYSTDAWISTYNGKVLREFYYDDKEVPDPENAAQLKVTLGPLAKYPGYYTSNLGFLDDAVYIQDGRFYQAFSYLLKIDERISKYKEVVKTLLHPAGMSMFGGYELRNELDVIPEIISYLAFIAYKLQTVIDSPVDELTEKVFGKALDEIQAVADNISSKGIAKSLSDVLQQQTESTALLVTKPLLEIVNEFSESTNKNISKRITDTNNVIETYSLTIGKNLTESVSNSDSVKADITKSLTDIVQQPNDNHSLLFSTQYSEFFEVSDLSSKTFNKSVEDIVLSSTRLDSFDITKALSDDASVVELPSIEINKTFYDGVSITEEIVTFGKILDAGDVLSEPIDAISSINIGKGISDDVPVSETPNISLSKTVSVDLVQQTDSSILTINKGISDFAMPEESGYVEFNPYIELGQNFIVSSEHYVGDRITF